MRILRSWEHERVVLTIAVGHHLEDLTGTIRSVDRRGVAIETNGRMRHIPLGGICEVADTRRRLIASWIR